MSRAFPRPVLLENLSRDAAKRRSRELMQSGEAAAPVARRGNPWPMTDACASDEGRGRGQRADAEGGLH